MPTPNQIRDQINEIVRYLVEIGLADDQNFAFQRAARTGIVETTFQHANQVSVALRDNTYSEIYQKLAQERAYNVKLPDGAMIQMMYVFSYETLETGSHSSRHHSLSSSQNDPDVYLDDEIYADIVAKNVVSFPIRFDYDARDDFHQALVHPKSHMTLGQYENCRIPVTAPMTPVQFIDFILRNFYHTAFIRYADNLPLAIGSFPDSIVPSERNVVHVAVPA